MGKSANEVYCYKNIIYLSYEREYKQTAAASELVSI